MSRYSSRLPSDYAQAERMLGKRDQRTLFNNTVIHRGGNRRVFVTHHGSVIGSFEADGSVMLTNAGYGSVSTRERLNGMTPPSLGFVQKNHAQMIMQRAGDEVTYTPGGTVQIAPDGTVTV